MSKTARDSEVAFCGEVKSWVDALCGARPELPFSGARIEQYGHGSLKRQDLRLFNRKNHAALCGEVKLPGTPEGRSPYDAGLMQDANQKAESIRCRYFFTWNVNTLVLFDRQLWDRLPFERRIMEWSLGLNLTKPEDVTRPEVRKEIQEVFLPRFLTDFADIYLERIKDWGLPPDEIFIRSLESHLDSPVHITADYLAIRADKDRSFDSRLQSWMASEMEWTFLRENHDEWRQAIDRAARTLAYVFANRVIFFEAIRSRFSDELRPLTVPKEHKDPDDLYLRFQKRFQEAVEVTGDYEPIFYPAQKDWAGPHIFAGPGAADAWASLLSNIRDFNFRAIPYDIVGKIFQRLISPEERHKFGQHFTSEDIVDVINAFCIRKPDATLLDPACGSASFLVRAYHRKAFLNPAISHQQRLREIFGCDIALFAAHLATLNLAAREIKEEENYPFIARRNFFEVEPRKPFCAIPGGRGRKGGPPPTIPIELPEDLDAVVGNPPYVRQELIPRKNEIDRRLTQAQKDTLSKQTKEYLQALVSSAWPGLELSGRSDFHCYFWPAAARFLKEGGYFGFLTSSSWLDVDYGFALQGWILQNFKLVAVMESLDEPWFEDARIKTAVTILQRCSDADDRDSNLVKFVRFFRPVAEILGDRPSSDEAARQKAAEKLRRLIEKQKTDFRSDLLRIIVVKQADLWKQGLEVAELLERKKKDLAPPQTGDEQDEAEEETEEESSNSEAEAFKSMGGYGGGKWGRYLRAPDLYFDIMRGFGRRFVRLGEIADIRFGVKSGCDAFFMPHDVTAKMIEEYSDDKSWRRAPLVTPCDRSVVAKGHVKIIQAGDKSLHPIEAKYLRAEVHSPMQVDRPIVRGKDMPRLILWVDKPATRLTDRLVKQYLRYGETHPFASKKSEAVPVPQRSTCASRPLWHDLTGIRPGIALWPMAQQYRHIIPANPERLPCNHRFFDVEPEGLNESETAALTAILNSTIVALFKNFYGRYVGTEGNLDTEVIDVLVLEIPDPRRVTPVLLTKLKIAFEQVQSREVGRMVEEAFMDCHTAERVRRLALTPIGLPKELQQPDRRAMDDAVFELLGVSDPSGRSKLIDQLYEETAKHYRQIRIVEVQKMEQRSKGKASRFTAADLAEDLWETIDADLKTPLSDWLSTLDGGTDTFTIPPEGKLIYHGNDDFFDAANVYFEHDTDRHKIACAHADQAALLAKLASFEIRGPVKLPSSPAACKQWSAAIASRLSTAETKFQELASARTSLDKLRTQAVELLMRWLTIGRKPG